MPISSGDNFRKCAGCSMGSARRRAASWLAWSIRSDVSKAAEVERLAQAAGVAVRWRPFLLGPIFGSQGWNDSPFNIYPVKGKYMWRDLARLCAAQGLALNHPSQFPRGSMLAARIACRYVREPWMGAFVRRVYEANFVDDLDISSPFVIGQILTSIGQMPAEIMKAAQLQETKDAFRAQNDQAVALGLVGARPVDDRDVLGDHGIDREVEIGELLEQPAHGCRRGLRTVDLTGFRVAERRGCMLDVRARDDLVTEVEASAVDDVVEVPTGELLVGVGHGLFLQSVGLSGS